MRGFLDWRDATPNDLDVHRPRGFAHCLAESRFGHQWGAISDLVPSGPSAQAVVEVGGGGGRVRLLWPCYRIQRRPMWGSMTLARARTSTLPLSLRWERTGATAG